MSTPESPFRVIVVGGGVAGLAASHVLYKAGIDHVVLEKRSTVAPQAGASIAIYPNGARILSQLGCLDRVKKTTVRCGRWYARLPSGKKIIDSSFFRYLEDNHGFGMLNIERREFLEALYETLPDKTRVKTNSPVHSITQDENGVEVVLSNGEVYKGDLVLGCDGVYSMVKSIMWDYANKASPGMITVKEKTAIKADYKCLVFMTTGIPELGTSDLTVIHGKHYSHLFTITPQRGYFFVYFKLDKPSTWPAVPRYTDQDADDLARRVADQPMSETLTFAEIWKHRVRATVVNLEEGILDHWYFGRIALAGDSAHKVMPNMALGGNASIESVSVLTNHLRQMLVDNHWKKPSSAEIEKALARYQKERLERMKMMLKFSSITNEAQNWPTVWYRILSTWLIPLLPQRVLADNLGRIISSAPKLDFLEVGEFPTGRMPWKYTANEDIKPSKSGYGGLSQLGLGV
ncbi:FAD binding domain protein [Durotheca rogersii]|uniref:FAD binding domain protein n=1 Tax=Durotheca rogersii TaxID=419775 RepID=UPI00222101C4|nr:FAD binding domain protein [Durotheca rogersii]KAI5867263.1 FAD binding domain protein [Durotheca rogersii]